MFTLAFEAFNRVARSISGAARNPGVLHVVPFFVDPLLSEDALVDLPSDGDEDSYYEEDPVGAGEAVKEPDGGVHNRRLTDCWAVLATRVGDLLEFIHRAVGGNRHVAGVDPFVQRCHHRLNLNGLFNIKRKSLRGTSLLKSFRRIVFLGILQLEGDDRQTLVLSIDP